MASTVLMQSILASPGTVVNLSRRNGTYSIFQTAPLGSKLQYHGGLRVRCNAKETEDEKISPIDTDPSPKPTPPPKAKISTKFSDLFAFSGPAPERINGRLAMIGFVAAMAVELSKGQDLFEQINHGGIPWFVGTSVVLSVASLVPLFKGVTAEAKSEGLMTSDAELWNGRFAMLGLVALAFTEYVKGGTLV